MSAKTVFISYRRDSTGKLFARLLAQELTRHGYDVFLDVDSMDPGKWADQILTQVPLRSHFLLLLTAGALDRCADEADWVRREFEIAVKSERNIVPIREESVDLKQLGDNCPESVRALFDFQIASIQHGSFKRDVEDLVARFIPSHKAPQIRSEDKPSVRVDISRIDKYAPAELIGREAELKILSAAWQQAVNEEAKRPHILTFVALGGEGKTSLVAKWAADLAYQGWPGCDAAFAWSFYSQGTSDKTQASSDSFLKDALLFFGDAELANSAASSFDKGRRIAQLAGERRALLILDGLEPLQYSPTSPTGSELKDQGVAALLKALASNNNGLCVVTTRYSIPDLRNFWQRTAPEITLKSLSIEAGVALLRRLGVKGTQHEFEQLVIDVKGHALTLNLLGSFLRDAHAGDIRKRDLVKLEEADAEEQSGHAFHVMDAYVKSFKSEGEKGMRALSVLRLLGLFDRPATADCLNALWTGKEIGGLTGALLGLSEAHRNITLKRLGDLGLITINRNEASELISLDAHPLLREYFATRVREQLPGAWLAAHRRLYEYLVANTLEGDEPTLEDLQPLYQAVAHGCQAGLQKDALETVYIRRIFGERAYSIRQLAAFGSDLGTLASFFETPWTRVAPFLEESDQGWLLNTASFYLRALGRLSEALEPMRAGMNVAAGREAWKNASIGASNLSELELTLGFVAIAVEDARQAVAYVDRSSDVYQQETARARHADALHQAGRRYESLENFREAEQIHAQNQPNYPLIYSINGFQYCDWLLGVANRAAWQQVLRDAGSEPMDSLMEREQDPLSSCHDVAQRAATTLEWGDIAYYQDVLSMALDHLTLARAALNRTILEKSEVTYSRSAIEDAVSGLRRAGTQHWIPAGLLTSAWLRFLEGKHIGPDSAYENLNEAWEIAERGPMRLHMADIHLYRARLFHAVKPYPWNKFPDGREGRGPKDDLDAAEKLITDCGYHRRDEELADAKLAILGKG